MAPSPAQVITDAQKRQYAEEGYFILERVISDSMPAGGVAVFSSVCFHRSGENRGLRMRCVYLMQYSPEPAINLEGKLSGLADPFLQDGKQVA